MTPWAWFWIVIGAVFFLMTAEFWLTILGGVLWLIGEIIGGLIDILGGLIELFIEESWDSWKNLSKPVRNGVFTVAAVAAVFGSIFSLAYFLH